MTQLQIISYLWPNLIHCIRLCTNKYGGCGWPIHWQANARLIRTLAYSIFSRHLWGRSIFSLQEPWNERKALSQPGNKANRPSSPYHYVCTSLQLHNNKLQIINHICTFCNISCRSCSSVAWTFSFNCSSNFFSSSSWSTLVNIQIYISLLFRSFQVQSLGARGLHSSTKTFLMEL